MADITLAGQNDLAVTLKRSRRAKRISLRVSSTDGRVTLTLPHHVSERAGLEFVAEKSDWIRKAQSKTAPASYVRIGTEIPVEGISRRIVEGAGKRAKLYAAAIEAPLGREGVTTEALLKAMARDRLTEASDRYARAVDRPITKITLRDTRSRWGSCTETGNLMYSWRLILAPPDVLDYVAAHEVAHLVHMDHSQAFWGLVTQLKPDFEDPRDWLRRDGAGLHRFRFRAD